MNIGMLWFDNDAKADLTVKIQRAASYYHDKYGKDANLCYVHPSMAPGANGVSLRSGGIEIRTTSSVLPNHLWIGHQSPA